MMMMLFRSTCVSVCSVLSEGIKGIRSDGVKTKSELSKSFDPSLMKSFYISCRTRAAGFAVKTVKVGH